LNFVHDYFPIFTIFRLVFKFSNIFFNKNSKNIAKSIMNKSTVLLLATIVGLTTAWDQPDDVMGRTGGYPYEPSIEHWCQKNGNGHPTKPPPYLPPKDWEYNTTGGPVEGKINVHLVPHTHDDTGWQITVDQYFYQDVYYVIDTIVSQLQKDPNRKFMYVETGFFARWWDQQTTKKKNIVKGLVKSRQLEFINGGWCMHDEAAPLYTEMVDQTTRGHQFLKKNFGSDAVPKGTWQIDPFGHSNTQAWLLGAEAGMESMFWGRTDFQDFNVRKNTSRLEWVWEGSQSLGKSAQIFAGELYGGGGGGYGTWIGFDGPNNQVQDDPSRHDYNVDKMVDEFIQNAQKQAAHTATNHQMWACGSDFQYQNADHWYRNLDKLIHYVNQNGTVNAFYSTPTRYVEQKKLAQKTWEVRRDDIFPLADAGHHYWSGYFTSRPALKRQVRFATNFLSSARQLEVVAEVHHHQWVLHGLIHWKVPLV
jgi:alpha-mannosidase